MKKIVFCLLLLVVAPSFGQWTIQPRVNENHFRAVDFVDINHGWIVGNDKTILRTVDGGVTWEDLSMANADSVYAYFQYVKFFDSQRGVVVGNEHSTVDDRHTKILLFYFTEDGGDTWRNAVLPVDWDWGVTDVTFLDNGKGWVSLGHTWTGFPHKNMILKTTDYGKSWETVFERDTLVASSLAFVNDNTGYGTWTYYVDNFDPSFLMKTDDGGRHWRMQGEISASIRDLAVYEKNTIIGLGFFSLCVSRDQGKSWRYADFSYEGFLPQNVAVHDQSLWVVGAEVLRNIRGLVYGSVDGGEHWLLQYELADEYFQGVCIADHPGQLSHMGHYSAWVVGQNGMIVNNPDFYLGNYKLNDGHILLEQNYPNPFTVSSGTNVLVILTSEQKIWMTLYDVLGRKIKTLFTGVMPRGEHQGIIEPSDLIYKGNPLPSGVYFLEVKSSIDHKTIKMVLLGK